MSTILKQTFAVSSAALLMAASSLAVAAYGLPEAPAAAPASSMPVSSPASPSMENNWYIGGFAGVTMPRDVKIKLENGSTETYKSRTRAGFGGVVGYRDGQMRYQLQYDYSKLAFKDMTSSYADVHTVAAKAFYDIDTGSAITPYLGAGVGYTRLSSIKDSLVADKKSEGKFSWQADAGVNVGLSDRLMAQLGYTILGTSKFKVLGDKNLYRHAINAGLIYFIG